jgi:hypothetical protein
MSETSFFIAEERYPILTIVMRGLVSRIHVFLAAVKTWMAGTTLAMTTL